LRPRYEELVAERAESRNDIARISGEINALPPRATADDASASIVALRDFISDADHDLGRMTAHLAAAQRAAEEVTKLDHDIAILERKVDAMRLLVKAYGRTGVQARMVEGAVASIEEYANDFLARFTDGMTLELRTQRNNKDGGLRETLDIMVSDSAGTRAIENYSGGERTRVNFALSVGLARFLSTHHEGNIESFAVDEPSFLDASGFTELIACLSALSASVPFVALVTHERSVIDAFPQRIVVSKGASGSKAEVVAG